MLDYENCIRARQAKKAWNVFATDLVLPWSTPADEAAYKKLDDEDVPRLQKLISNPEFKLLSDTARIQFTIGKRRRFRSRELSWMKCEFEMTIRSNFKLSTRGQAQSIMGGSLCKPGNGTMIGENQCSAGPAAALLPQKRGHHTDPRSARWAVPSPTVPRCPRGLLAQQHFATEKPDVIRRFGQ